MAAAEVASHTPRSLSEFRLPTALFCQSSFFLSLFCLPVCRKCIGRGSVFRGSCHTQRPRVRQFCVDIAPTKTVRNIDAELLREHSVRRYCAHYKGLQIFANSTHASTLASKLRKKLRKSACAKKEKKIRMRKKSWDVDSNPGFLIPRPVL